MRILKQNFQLRIALILFLFILFTASVFSTTTGLDLVVIVDQSGSMSGFKSKAKNDPLGVRNDMVRRTFELLAKDGVLNKVTHRLGVVSFGTAVRVDLPLSEINLASVDQLRNRLDASLTDASLGNTHFLAAFEEAKKMFAGKKADGRNRVIILITDGAPFIEGIQIGSYVKELRDLIESSFPYPDYKIHVIALNDAESDYWERYRDFWRTVSHNQARKLEGDKEHIFRAFHEIVNDLLGTAAEHISPAAYDNVVIPPYLESVIFDIFRVDPEASVEILPADHPERPLEPTPGKVEFVNVGKTIQTISVRRPPPGRWIIRKSNEESRIDIFTQKFFPRGELLQPSAQEVMYQYERTFITYRVVDGDGNPIQELPGYPLTLELSLVKPDSSRVREEMRKDLAMGEGVFRTIRDVECDQAGRYGTEVLIATKDLNDQQVTVFRDQYSGFEVKSAQRIDCKIVSPTPYEKIPIYGPVVVFTKPALNLAFKFVDKNEQPVNLPAIFSGPSTNLLSIDVVHGDREEKARVDLKDKGSGVLTGKMSDLGGLGEYRLRARPNKALVPSHYTVRVTPAEVPFTRHLTPVHWAQFILLVMALLSSTALGGYRFWMNLRYPLRGILYIDRLGGGLLKEYPLTRRKNRIVIEELPIQTTIKKIIVRARPDRRGGIIVTAIGEKKFVFLKNRTLPDKGQASLPKIPYILRYRA